MEAIANKLGISRSTVSRLIASARDEGLVRISLHAPEEPRDSLSRRIEDLYDVDVTVVQVPGATTEIRRLERVAGVAGNLVGDGIEDKMMVGIAWALQRYRRHLPGVTIVQLNGAANPTTTGLPYVGEILGNFTRAFGAKAFPFPVPAFFDYAETRDLMWRERSIQVVRDIGRNADVAVFGVGSFTSPLPSHVYAGGYLSPEARSFCARTARTKTSRSTPARPGRRRRSWPGSRGGSAPSPGPRRRPPWPPCCARAR